MLITHTAKVRILHNGFYFKTQEKIGYDTYQHNLTVTLEAFSFANEIAVYEARSTFLLSIILRIPAVIVGISKFRKVCEKKKPEAKETEAKETMPKS